MNRCGHGIRRIVLTGRSYTDPYFLHTANDTHNHFHFIQPDAQVDNLKQSIQKIY